MKATITEEDNGIQFSDLCTGDLFEERPDTDGVVWLKTDSGAVDVIDDKDFAEFRHVKFKASDKVRKLGELEVSR